MYFTREEIKRELVSHREEITEDNLPEWADGFVPVYYSDILKDWTEMPSEYADQWKEYGYDTQRNDGGIMNLMQIDLVFYYLQLTQEVWEEIQNEREEETENV